jgi:hypothetical protein
MTTPSHTNGQGHFRALHKFGSAGLSHCGEYLSFDTLARQIVSEASLHQGAARTLSIIAGFTFGVDGFWRNVRRFNSCGAMVISDGEVFQKVRGKVQLCAHLLHGMRALGFFEPDAYACAALGAKASQDSRLQSLIGSATRETGDHVTAPLTLAQWFRCMDYLIGGMGVGPVRGWG